MSRTKVIQWVLFLVALACVVFEDVVHGATPRPPNIVYILADDPSCGELGSCGEKLIRAHPEIAPSLERLLTRSQSPEFPQHEKKKAKTSGKK